MTAPATLPSIAPRWAVPGVGAAMSTRAGGVSTGPFASLDLGAAAGEAPASVAENRRRFAAMLGARPVWLRQVHGAGVLRLDAETPDRPDTPADACWTSERGIACVVSVADCLPVLLASADGTVVGAAHAGWRGLAAGILEATISAMAAPGDRLLAWLGPAIGPAAFEVGADVVSAFTADDAGAASAFVVKTDGKWGCDLYALARRRLRGMGVERVYGGGHCTFNDEQYFYSYRREGVTGRMASLIWTV